MTTLPDAAAEVLQFWLGELHKDGLADVEVRKRWFAPDPALDALIVRRFQALHTQLRCAVPASWTAPRAQLAAVIVLDQFSRNMFRGTADMFASDAAALAIAESMVDAGHAEALATHELTFAYMPFMHSEALADQQRCVALFTQLRDTCEGAAREAVESNLHFAIKHREIIERFGRFPHRNATLGRDTTPEEVVFLQQAGSSF